MSEFARNLALGENLAKNFFQGELKPKLLSYKKTYFERIYFPPNEIRSFCSGPEFLLT